MTYQESAKGVSNFGEIKNMKFPSSTSLPSTILNISNNLEAAS
jgi:hypothetical protein